MDTLAGGVGPDISLSGVKGFEEKTYHDRGIVEYKVGAAMTGIPGVGQHADRMPCFRSDKCTTRRYEYSYHTLVKKVTPISLEPPPPTKGDSIDERWWHGWEEASGVLAFYYDNVVRKLGLGLSKHSILSRRVYLFNRNRDKTYASTDVRKGSLDLGDYVGAHPRLSIAKNPGFQFLSKSNELPVTMPTTMR